MKNSLLFSFCIIALACVGRQVSKSESRPENNSVIVNQSSANQTAAGANNSTENETMPINNHVTPSTNSEVDSAILYSKSNELFKPQTSGLALRDFSWLDTENTSIEMLKIVNSFIVKIYWNDIQTSENGELKHPNAVDDALAYVKKMNTQYPDLKLNLKIRLYCGIYTPEWVKEKAGTFTMYKGGMGKGATPTSFEVAKFWKPEFLQAYSNIQSKLAAAYDNIPEITEAVNSGTGITYAEAMIRNVGTNGAGKKNALSFSQSDYSSQKDIAAIKNTIDAMSAWKKTRVSMVFTPFFIINGQGASEDLSVTKNILDYFVNKFGAQAILGNNGLRDKNSGDNSDRWEEGGSLDQVYDMLENYYKIKNNGIYFQTATVERVGNLKSAIEQGIQRGAGMIELPTGSKGLLKFATLAELKKYDEDLENQAKK